jgi:hypothetical protein
MAISGFSSVGHMSAFSILLELCLIQITALLWIQFGYLVAKALKNIDKQLR